VDRTQQRLLILSDRNNLVMFPKAMWIVNNCNQFDILIVGYNPLAQPSVFVTMFEYNHKYSKVQQYRRTNDKGFNLNI